MEYAIFPMKVINITQRANSSYSHKNLEALDIAGSDTKIEAAYAPCRVKALAKLVYETSGFSNTVFFGSCDKSGNPAKVKIENGEEKILTFALTHDNDISDIAVGQIYESGKKIYDEGTKGNATGNHIHIEVAEGWQTKKQKRADGKWATPNIAKIGSIFYQLKGWNEIKKANGYTFKTVETRDVMPSALSNAMKVFLAVAKKTELSPEEKTLLGIFEKPTIADAMRLFLKAAKK